ncbi:hypothetical protein K32_03200 [Kaistia sp. 32K]|nr:hypothetical protein K32_03200 [Kaistia sp. 32K]
MCRRIGLATLTMALLAAAAPGAGAETIAPSPAPGSSAASDAEIAPRAGRYTMVPAAGGFVRLDTQTGAVSHCQRGDAAAGGVWHCAAIPEDVLTGPKDALTGPKDALAGPKSPEASGGDVAELQRQVAALRTRIDEIERRQEPKLGALPSGDPELDRAMNFSQELMRRFFGMVRELKQDADEGRI